MASTTQVEPRRLPRPAAEAPLVTPAAALPWRTARILLVAAAVLALVVPLTASLGLQWPGRPLLAAAFMLVVPGLPAAIALRLREPRLTLGLGFASSLAVHLLTGSAVIALHVWHPVLTSWVPAVVGLALAAVGWRRNRPEAPGADGETDPEDAPGSRTAVDRRFRAGALATLGVVAVFWYVTARTVDLDQTGALGLLPVLPWTYYVCLVLLAAVVALALRNPRLDVLVLTVAALMVTLVCYTTVTLADGSGSVPVAWLHVTFIEYINHTGTVPLGVDARFSWPGFFAAGAQLVSLAGTADAVPFVQLAPPVNFLLVLPSLLVIGRCVTRSRRWAWVGVFVFVLTNWYQQDYFAPQATAFVLYTSVLATMLWMASTAGVPLLAGTGLRRFLSAPGRTPARPERLSSAGARALLLLLVVIVAGVAVGHQLTPPTLALVLLVFCVLGFTRYRLLWLVTGLVTAAWVSYGATDFWRGHLGAIFGDVGDVGKSLDAGVSGRLVGDPVYQRSQFVRIGWSGLLFVVAMLAIWWRRRDRDTFLLLCLAGAPFALLAAQSYGGEVVIRCFLYASPVLSALAADAVRMAARRVLGAGRGSRSARTPRARAAVLVTTVLVLVLAEVVLTFTRGLNTSFERTPPEQIQASAQIYATARPGDVIGLPFNTGLTPYHDLTVINLEYLELDTCQADRVEECFGAPLARYIVLTLTQEKSGELVQGRPPGWLWALGEQLLKSGRYERTFRTPEVWVLQLKPEYVR